MARDLSFAAASAAYLVFVFQLGTWQFWHVGMGDWLDPYFVNYLLEHWFVSASRLGDPASPPMFHPSENALGYSVSLILYAPIYIGLRLALHPFQAFSLTLFAVMWVGTVSLYLFLRRVLGATALEASALAAFFVTSPNVMNGWIGVWSQRASVFLIPPILLMLAAAMRMQDGRGRSVLAGAGGLLGALLLTHDFYTAVLATAVAVLFLPAAGATGPLHLKDRLRAARTLHPLFVAAVAIGMWALWVWLSGGVSSEMLGARISSRDWRRPAIVALALAALLVYRDRGAAIRALLRRVPTWQLALAGGACVGVVIFLWIHAAAFREHSGFDYGQVLDQLVVLGRRPYESLRSFVLAGTLAALAWMPWVEVDSTARRRLTWLALASVAVLILPIRVGGASLWNLLYYVPGVSAVRDPKRLVYFYELALVLALGAVLIRFPTTSLLRRVALGLVAAFVITQPNTTRLYYARPNATYAQWVEAPIVIDPSCRSFFVRPASEAYTLRPDGSWTMYHLDAMYVALRASVPTLHGYSAWTPEGWGIGNPAAPDYLDGVDGWIARNGLPGVCELDIERRTMTPYAPR